MASEVIGYDNDVVIAERVAQQPNVVRFDPGKIRHKHDRRPRAAGSGVAQRPVDDRRKRCAFTIPQYLGTTGASEVGDVIAVRSDKHAIELARAQDVQRVLDQLPRKPGALVVSEHGSQP